MIYFVPTPIGNLEDITLRSIKAIESSCYLICEDSRETKRLLRLLNQKGFISKSTDSFEYLSFHSHTNSTFFEKNLEIFENSICSYLSDAGMPCISDPGSLIVDFCIKKNIKYSILPGANAALLALSGSGFLDKEFLFYGFLSHKRNQRLKELEEIFSTRYNTILYESPHRIWMLLEEICELDSKREIFVTKELTKLYESSYKDSAKNLLKILKDKNLNGEWCVVIKGVDRCEKKLGLQEIKSLNLPPKVFAKILGKLENRATKECYNELLGDKNLI